MPLDVADLDPDPLALLGRWVAEARAAGMPEPTAMCLATADAAGRPSTRMVLLKDADQGGLTWYTNYSSRKGRELAENPHAAITLFWAPLARQVTARGPVERLDAGESDAYFATRPRGSQLGAWASPQSAVIPDRAVLEERFAAAASEHEGREVPRPPHWGGYRLRPEEVVFWHGRSDRLHDRFRYRRHGDSWQVQRLAP